MHASLTRLRGRAGVLLALVVMMLGGATFSLASASAASHHRRSHHSTRHHSTHHSSGIPQGKNAGDGDSDNHGGPSDGDGNI